MVITSQFLHPPSFPPSLPPSLSPIPYSAQKTNTLFYSLVHFIFKQTNIKLIYLLTHGCISTPSLLSLLLPFLHPLPSLQSTPGSYFASAHKRASRPQLLTGPHRHTSHTRLAQSLVPKAHVSNNKKCGNSVMPGRGTIAIHDERG